MNKEDHSEKEVQVLRHKCCNKIYAVCILPDCYTDKDWLKDVKEAVKDGDGIEIIKNKDAKMEICTCL